MGGASYVVSPDHVVLNRFNNVFLHKWHVLVGGGMEHGADGVTRDGFLDAGGAKDVADFGRQVKIGMPLAKIHGQHEHLALSLIEDHELARRETRQLAAQLGTNGATAASD